MIKPNPEKHRIGVLDSFRGIAAFAVMMHHFTFYRFHAGIYGVQLFFIISGFVIFDTIERADSVFEFGVKRFLRLFPLFWVCLIMTTLVVNIAGTPHIGLRQFLGNTTMIHELLGITPVDNSYWSLVPELFFYFFIAAVYLCRQLKHIELVGLVWLSLIISNAFLGLEDHFQLLRLLNMRHGQMFFAGILFYKLFKGQGSKFTIPCIILCYLVSLKVYSGKLPFLEVFIVLTGIFALFSLFILDKLNFLDKGLLRFLGAISYPLYLIHQRLGQMLILWLQRFTGTVAAVIISVFVFIGIAYLLHKLVELPVAKYSKRANEYFKKKLLAANQT